MSSPARPWIKPLAIGAVVLGLAGLGAATFAHKERAPNVTFHGIKGEQFATKDLRGKVVMVNFWATSCTTCMKEMPQMIATFNKYHPQGLEFVAVAMKYDPPNYVLNFAETRQLPFKVTLDVDGTAAQAFNHVQLTPSTFVIGKDGTILKFYLGEPPFDELHRILEQALKS